DDRRAVSNVHTQAAEGVDRRAGTAVRLLPVGADHVGRGAARAGAESNTRPNRRCDDRQHLPLRNVSADSSRDSTRGPRVTHVVSGFSRTGVDMTATTLTRRVFLKTATAAGGG